MEWNLLFFLNSALLGVGLAMDAFSVSLANGLNEPDMSVRRMVLIAGVFGAFQTLMPLIGWGMVRFLIDIFQALDHDAEISIYEDIASILNRKSSAFLELPLFVRMST